MSGRGRKRTAQIRQTRNQQKVGERVFLYDKQRVLLFDWILDFICLRSFHKTIGTHLKQARVKQAHVDFIEETCQVIGVFFILNRSLKI